MFYSMFAIVSLTFFIGLFAVKARFASVKNGSVKVKYYQLMQGEDVPELITKTTRCYNNMFELPVLFYIICVLYISLNIETKLGLYLAWVFVLSRYLHTYIHLSYNHILHRMMMYWVGFICIIALWLNLLLIMI